MYFQKRGGEYSFVYYDLLLRKNRRLLRGDTPSIASDLEAEAFCQQWDHSHLTTQSKIEAKISWINDYPEWSEKLKMYERSRKEDAPYSFRTNVYYLKYHVFSFFLGLKREIDAAKWPLSFEEFRDHLQTVKPVKNTDGHVFSYSTMNGILKSLNSFMLVLHRRNLIPLHVKCRLFQKSKCRQKSEESIIAPLDQGRIYLQLLKTDPLSAKFFYICLHTGLRINEALGLSLSDFFQGFPDCESLKKVLEHQTLPSYGFLCLESQPSLSPHLRDPSGYVPRKPLKGKRTISAANSRTIPLFDLESTNLLIELWNDQQKLFEISHHGKNPKDYLLFEGLNRNIYSNRLRLVQHTIDLDTNVFYTPHDCRHTYSTWLAAASSGNFDLCRMVLGHASIETTLGYVHIGARIARQVRARIQLERPMKILHEEKKSNVIPFPPRKGPSYE